MFSIFPGDLINLDIFHTLFPMTGKQHEKKIQVFQDGWDRHTRAYLEQETCDLGWAGGEVECVLKHADADM